MFRWLKSIGTRISSACSKIKPVLKSAYSWVANRLSGEKFFLNVFAEQKIVEIENNTNRDFEIAVSDVDNFDWIRDGRPDKEETFHGKKVSSKTAINKKMNVNRIAKGSFTLTFNYTNGLKDELKINGIRNSGDVTFTHEIKSHIITISSFEDKVVIRVKNTQLQIENEFAEKHINEGVRAMRKKCFEDAVNSFEEASKTANETETLNSIEKYKRECYDLWEQDTMQKTQHLREEGRSFDEKNDFEGAIRTFEKALKIYEDAEKNIPGGRFKKAIAEVEKNLQDEIELKQIDSECSQIQFRKKGKKMAVCQQLNSNFRRQM